MNIERKETERKEYKIIIADCAMTIETYGRTTSAKRWNANGRIRRPDMMHSICIIQIKYSILYYLYISFYFAVCCALCAELFFFSSLRIFVQFSFNFHAFTIEWRVQELIYKSLNRSVWKLATNNNDDEKITVCIVYTYKTRAYAITFSFERSTRFMLNFHWRNYNAPEEEFVLCLINP